MATILLTGGTGLIGRQLSLRLVQRGYNVHVLSRSNVHIPIIKSFQWIPEKNYIDERAFEGVNTIVHLAGVNISGHRWNKRYKEVIVNSRVQTADLIFQYIQKSGLQPDSFISASAVGYYGFKESESVFTETDPPGNDFLAETCRIWENASEQFKEAGIRTVLIRTGVVLSASGGALPKMIWPVNFGLGAALGTGCQIFPWIHIDDLCNIYIKAIEDSNITGTYNAVAPEYITNAAFTQSLAKVLKKPLWLPNVPSFVLRIVFGEMAQILLTGNKISAQKMVEAGYVFQYPKTSDALHHLLGK